MKVSADASDEKQQPESESAGQVSADGPLNLKPSTRFVSMEKIAEKPQKFQEQK